MACTNLARNLGFRRKSTSSDEHCRPPVGVDSLSFIRVRKRRRARLTRRQLRVVYRDRVLARGRRAYGLKASFCARLKASLGDRRGAPQIRSGYAPALCGTGDVSGKTLALRSGRGERAIELPLSRNGEQTAVHLCLTGFNRYGICTEHMADHHLTMHDSVSTAKCTTPPWPVGRRPCPGGTRRRRMPRPRETGPSSRRTFHRG